LWCTAWSGTIQQNKIIKGNMKHATCMIQVMIQVQPIHILHCIT
jgi:hypothetical protein